MIVIAFTQRLIENTAYPETRDCLDVRWAWFCKQLNVLPLILPTTYEFEKYFDHFNIGGIVLTGGNDLSSVSESALSNLRDTFEISLLTYAINHSIPVLGICRGMQLVASCFGVTLVPVEGHIGIRHQLVPGASAGEGYGRFLSENMEVNSYHSYALRDAPNGFSVIARSCDGAIEAIQHSESRIFCQMWHPERENNLTANEQALYSKLFELQ